MVCFNIALQPRLKCRAWVRNNVYYYTLILKICLRSLLQCKIEIFDFTINIHIWLQHLRQVMISLFTLT